ncbi:MAG: ribosome maturation factor RimP [Nevskiaceae bacterium]|jgi:ribosome maturation factor RimP|nr:ribosome maturation factor RimP [Nevskiaceae bacterium]
MLRDRLMELVEPLVARLGYELVDVEFVSTRSEATLRVYIDRSAGAVITDEAQTVTVGDEVVEARESGIGVDDCERVSRELSALLDAEDPITVSYQLEVSSPGADRVLRTPEHYRRFVGSRVLMELLAARDGRRRFTGELISAGDDEIELNVDGKPVTAQYGQIERTRLAPDWSRHKPQGRKKR